MVLKQWRASCYQIDTTYHQSILQTESASLQSLRIDLAIDETVGVFIRETVWLENSLSQSEGRGTGRERGPSKETGCEGQRPPKWRPVVRM
jgi:hypothetical protein